MSAANPNSQESLERSTGKLFSALWRPYDDQQFEDSVQLFFTRLERARFDQSWFEGKVCLDAGYGGGRYSIGMARLGAEKVIGVDVGTEGLENARTRSAGLRNVEFRESSVLALPFPDGAFEMVWCAGVLQHTVDDVRTVDELARVTKAEGYLYLLVYATGGLRWPLIQWLRPLAAQVGQPAIERAIDMSGLPANKRRTFVDDLFCPRIDFYSWGRLEHMLTSRGFGNIERWGPECRLDHEADLGSYRADLEALAAVFGVDTDGDLALGGQDKPVFEVARVAVEATIDVICWFEDAVKRGDVSLDSAMSRVIGQGHHRVMARKEA